MIDKKSAEFIAALAAGQKLISEGIQEQNDKISLLTEACIAAIRYDDAIRRRVDGGDADLDALYEDWMTKARAAIARIGAQ